MPRRVPASMPGRIWESSAGPGRRTDGLTDGGRGRQQRKKRELFFFYFVCQPQQVHVYREKQRSTECVTKIVEADQILSSSAASLRVSSFRASAVRCPLTPSSLLLLRPNGSYRYGTDTRCPPPRLFQNVAYDISQPASQTEHRKADPGLHRRCLHSPGVCCESLYCHVNYFLCVCVRGGGYTGEDKGV